MMSAIAAALVATAALVAVTPTAGQAAADQWGRLWSNEGTSNTLLAIRGGVSAGAGADALLWVESYSGGLPVGDQMWKLQPVGNGEFWIRNAGTSNQFALSVEGNSARNGAHVIQWWFDATNQYQRWRRIYLDGSVMQFKNVATGKCLGTASPHEQRSQALIWDCGDGEDQKWEHVV